MQLSPLEASLIGGLVAVISSGTTGVLVKAILGGKYVTKEQCNEQHRHDQCRDDLIRKQQSNDMQELKKSSNIQFRMIRALITYSDIPKHEKEKILNTNGGGQ